jgi:DNA-binding MarR family transcriptional regulator
MLVIDATPLCRVHDIARAVAITVGGASQAVDRLESAGLSPAGPTPRIGAHRSWS